MDGRRCRCRLRRWTCSQLASSFRIFRPQTCSKRMRRAADTRFTLRHWDAGVPARENLRRLAFTPGSVLLEDAQGMLREELSSTGGYSQILAAIGRGRTRFSHIAGEVGQRIDHALDVLIRTGFVGKVFPVGAPRGARGTYEIPDPYLRFWFQVLYTETALIEGGQGDAVLERVMPRWQTHVGLVFEEQARAHARRLGATGRATGGLGRRTVVVTARRERGGRRARSSRQPYGPPGRGTLAGGAARQARSRSTSQEGPVRPQPDG